MSECVAFQVSLLTNTCRQFHYSKNHFWFSDEPVESVSNIREKHGNEHAAWARETGKGALFFSKRAEDKSTPSGMILLVSKLYNTYTNTS